MNRALFLFVAVFEIAAMLGILYAIWRAVVAAENPSIQIGMALPAGWTGGFLVSIIKDIAWKVVQELVDAADGK